MGGYMGKILRVNLSSRKISTIKTAEYEKWGGGHGMGSAIFWDLVKDKNISGFDERNIVTIMTSPLTGTMTPGASGRTEMQGIGVQSSPVEWFTRSNVGGRFGAFLKFAGYDGMVIEGKADQPVWLDIRNDNVKIRDAKNLWGLTTWKTQSEIWNDVSGGAEYKNWTKLGFNNQDIMTTQRPAVLAIGPAGENLSRMAAIIHDAGHAAGQGGFGAVWGSKNLKAVSVIGDQSIPVADPDGLVKARSWAVKNYGFSFRNPDDVDSIGIKTVPLGVGAPPMPIVAWKREKKSRPSACFGCYSGCATRSGTGKGNESTCVESMFYTQFDSHAQQGLLTRAASRVFKLIGQNNLSRGLQLLTASQHETSRTATDLLQQYGINAFELMVGLPYLKNLYDMGVLGPGKEIECDLPFDKIGSLEFAEKLLHMIAYRQGLGDDMAEGFYRAAQRWGRLEQDLASELLTYPYWGIPTHYDPRGEVEWGYGSIMGDRDINEHDFNTALFWIPTVHKLALQKPPYSAEEIVKIFSKKMVPFEDDPKMLDFSSDNMYSEHIAKLVAWHRYYTRFWKQSTLFCDWIFSDMINFNQPEKEGMTGKGEPKFFKVITGNELSFIEGIEIGRKIWNLDNAIWTLQGRHRDMVQFAEYIYKEPFEKMYSASLPFYLPGLKNGKWKYIKVNGRHIDREKFEEWKSHYYQLEGWSTATGWPTRKLLESMDLKNVADELADKGRLGA